MQRLASLFQCSCVHQDFLLLTMMGVSFFLPDFSICTIFSLLFLISILWLFTFNLDDLNYPFGYKGCLTLTVLFEVSLGLPSTTKKEGCGCGQEQTAVTRCAHLDSGAVSSECRIEQCVLHTFSSSMAAPWLSSFPALSHSHSPSPLTSPPPPLPLLLLSASSPSPSSIPSLSH